MADILYTDFETFSTIDLKTAGLWKYADPAATGVLCMAYAFNDEPVDIFYFHKDFPDGNLEDYIKIMQHIKAGKDYAAHNAAFEIAVHNNILCQRYLSRGRWIESLKPEQVICTMAECYAMNLPGMLDNAAAALGLRITKDRDGHALMLRMCRPMNAAALKDGSETVPTWCHESDGFTFMGQKITGEDAMLRLGQYCMQDVEVERAIHKRVMKLSGYERRVWAMDYRINQRGVLFDPEAVTGALAIRDTTTAKLNQEMSALTDGHVAACSSIPALKDWLADFGVFKDSLAKGEIEKLLSAEVENEDISERPDSTSDEGRDTEGAEKSQILRLPPPVARALNIRREAGRATSVTKLEAIRRHADISGRVHNLFQYHGAGTGRFAGRTIQPHNFTRDLPKPAVVEEIMALVKKGETELIDILYGPPLTTISKLLRGFIVSAKDKQLIGGDYSNVEGRGIAWLAGEEWKLDAFREYDAGTGPDLYCLAYANTFGVPVSQVDKKQRQIGKVEELALGYQGGVGAFKQMAAGYGVEVSDDEADDIKTGWRRAHPCIEQYWYDLQEAAWNAVKNPGEVYEAGAYGRQVKYKVAGSFLWCLLPSGRTLCYPYPRIDWVPVKPGSLEDQVDRKAELPKRPQLTYKTVPSADDRKKGRIVEDKNNTNWWARVGTYGGKLAENVTQAICRDLLVDAMLNLEDNQYPVVLHVHDEIITEGVYKDRDRKRVQEIMNTVPPWAKEFPLVSKCWMNPRYMKDD